MTTETTSPSLHERLREAEREGHDSDPDVVTYTYHDVPHRLLTAIEADIRAEATAPLLKKIEEMEAEIALLTRQNDSLGIGIKMTTKDYEKVLEQRYTLRAENAALRQAGDDLREAADEILKSELGDENWLVLTKARNAYDAATTPRAEETPEEDGNMSQEQLSAYRLSLADELANEICWKMPKDTLNERAEGLLQQFIGSRMEEAELAAPSPTDAVDREQLVTDILYTAEAIILSSVGGGKGVTIRSSLWEPFVETYLALANASDTRKPSRYSEVGASGGMSSPTDAAGEGDDEEPIILMPPKDRISLKCVGEKTFDDLMDRLAAFERRADDTRDRLYFLHSDTDRRLLDLESKMNAPFGDGGPTIIEMVYQQDIDICKINHGEIATERRLKKIKKRLSDLEARGPQPVAVTEAMVDAYQREMNRQEAGETMRERAVRGLTAAFAAMEVGK